jgi:hypothetical protein
LSAAKRTPIIVVAAAATSPIILGREASNGGDCIFMTSRIEDISQSKIRLCVNYSLKIFTWRELFTRVVARRLGTHALRF